MRAPPPRSPAPAPTSTRALRTPEVPSPSLPPRPRAPLPDPRAAGSKVNTKERRRPDGAAADASSEPRAGLAMAEGVPASPVGGAGGRGLHSGIIQW